MNRCWTLSGTVADAVAGEEGIWVAQCRGMGGDVSPAGVPLDMKGEGGSTGRPRGWLGGCCKPGRTVWGVARSRGFEGRLLPTSAENLECTEESALHPLQHH